MRIANSYISGALEVAAEYIENGVRRAENDCVRKTPKVLVVELCDARNAQTTVCKICTAPFPHVTCDATSSI